MQHIRSSFGTTLISVFCLFLRLNKLKIVEMSEIEDNCESADQKFNRKRGIINFATMDISPIKRLNHSSENLLDLNDYCLLEILEKLSHIDLCHVQNVCRRFVPLVESAFRRNIKTIKGWNKFHITSTTPNNRRVSSKFGHYMHSLNAWIALDLHILEQLTQLRQLTLLHVTIDWSMVDKIHSAKHLQVLKMYYCKFIERKTERNLSKNLRENNSPLFWFSCQDKLPPLDMFTEFLQFNQQLRGLSLPNTIPQTYISQIQLHAPQLTELLVFNNSSTDSNTNHLIRNVNNLKWLFISSREQRNAYDTPLFRGMVTTSSTLTHLKLKDFAYDKKVFKVIATMKNIHHLELRGRFLNVASHLVTMVAALPRLHSFILSFESCWQYDRSINCNIDVYTLKAFIEVGKELNRLCLVGIKGIEIDEEAYKELLYAVRRGNRSLSIAINGCKFTTSFNVPLNVRQTDLNIDYYCLRCSCESDL